jgi:hypothetical protein
MPVNAVTLMIWPPQQALVRRTDGSTSTTFLRMHHILKRFALTVTALLTAAPQLPVATATDMAWMTASWEKMQPGGGLFDLERRPSGLLNSHFNHFFGW